MEQLVEFYESLGVSRAVYAYGERTIEKLKDRFDQIDKIAEYNQAKVISAMQKHRVSAACFVGISWGRCLRESFPTPMPIAPDVTRIISFPAFLRSLSTCASFERRRIFHFDRLFFFKSG